MEKNTRIEGFIQLMNFLSDIFGPHSYQENFNAPKEELLPQNPFHHTRRLYVVGEPGVTASMGDLVRFLIERLMSIYPSGKSTIISLLVWKAKVPAGNNIAMGFRVRYESGNEEEHVAFGFTDYSGEGSKGYRNLSAIFKFLNDIYGIPIYEQDVPSEYFEMVEKATINRTYKQ